MENVKDLKLSAVYLICSDGNLVEVQSVSFSSFQVASLHEVLPNPNGLLIAEDYFWL